MGCWMIGLIVIALFVVLWKYLTRNHGYFKERGIPYEDAWPIFGSQVETMIKKKSAVDWLMDLTQKYAKNRFFGVFDFVQPRYIIQDPELIRSIGVKDFDHFVDHNFGGISEKTDELFYASLVNLKGQKWRDMRATLSPAFTGSKMRMMFELVNECGIQWTEHFTKRYREGEQPLLVDMKEALVKFGVNVISTCAFGISVNSLDEPDNEFFVNARKTFDFTSPGLLLKMILVMLLPKVADYFEIGFSPKEATQYFKRIILDTISQRKATNGFRPDVVQLLMQAREGSLTHEDESHLDEKGFAVVQESEVGKKKVNRVWSDTEIAAQAFLFLVGGFDTTSTAIMFTSYELALNRDVQERLIEEVDGLISELNGDPLTYEKLQKLEYLDAVISETLRKYPPGFILDRVCEKPYILEDENGRKIRMEKGANLWINVYGIHHTHKYFPNPEKFDPERFLGENKHKIQPNTYLPFGIGPRNCIGSRFALMEVKALIFYTLSKFTLEVCDETPIPMKFHSVGFLPEKKIILEFRPRKILSSA